MIQLVIRYFFLPTSVTEASDEIKNQRRKLLPIVSSQECDDYLINISSTVSIMS